MRSDSIPDNANDIEEIDIEDLVLLLNGTLCTNKPAPKTRIGDFAAYYLMYNPENIISKLDKLCEAKHKYHFDGPGTDVCNDDSNSYAITKVFWSFCGAFYGYWGPSGILNSLVQIKKILADRINAAKAEGKKIRLTIFSYSRGGLLTQEIIQQPELFDMDSLYLFNIDPVPGVLERLRLYWMEQKSDLDIPIFSHTIYSDTNIPGFNPLQIKCNNKNFHAYEYVARASHFGISGMFKGRLASDNPENLAADGVLGYILHHAPVKFAEEAQAAIESGKRSLRTLQARNLSPTNSRVYVSTDSPFTGSRRNIAPLNIWAQKKEKGKDDDADEVNTFSNKI